MESRAQDRSAGPEEFFRAEGDLVRRRGAGFVGYLARSVPGFRDQIWRTGGLLLSAPLRPLLRLFRPRAAARIEYLFLRGLSRDRLDRLGREFCEEVLAERILRRPDPTDRSVLLSGWPDHVVRPLARELGFGRIVCNRLEFRDGIATGRLLDPVVSPRARAGVASRPIDEPVPPPRRATVVFDGPSPLEPLSVPRSLAGREILLLGATGFIGKVWLSHLLHGVADCGRVHLLIRPRNGRTAKERFEQEVLPSPVFRDLDPARLRRIGVVSGDMTRAGLGLDAETRERFAGRLALIVNSGGMTEFNPDLRAALTSNVEATLNVLELARECGRTSLLHLSTCFVAGRRNGRVAEEVRPDYNPAGRADFCAEREREELWNEIRATEAAGGGGRLRQQLVAIGVERARRHGWPNTYTFTKSLAESLLVRRAGAVPYAIVRPSIVETSTRVPFPGWNEGINTSAPLSYLLGTAFRQLPSNERKCLDVVPVDLVARGMTLIAAALLEGRHHRLYQLATSGTNPCDMRRSIELTGLAHREHYRRQRGFEPWLKRRLETIAVSKRRYQTLSAPGQKRLVRALRRFLPFARLRRAERSLDRVEKLIELYEPFILDNDYVFEASRIQLLSAALPATEQDAFGYDHGPSDWSEYWIDIHIPALRRWSYPLLEGRPVGG